MERVNINSVINDLASAENGVVTFAFSTGREPSLEAPTGKIIENPTLRGTASVDMGWSAINDLASAENGVVTFASSTGREPRQDRQCHGARPGFSAR